MRKYLITLMLLLICSTAHAQTYEINGSVPGNNVGIGTTAAMQALDVAGTTRTTYFAATGGSPISGDALVAKDSLGNSTWSDSLGKSIFRGSMPQHGTVPATGGLRTSGLSSGPYVTTANAGPNATYVRTVQAIQSGFGLRITWPWFQMNNNENNVGNGATTLQAAVVVNYATSTVPIPVLFENGQNKISITDNNMVTGYVPGVPITAGQNIKIITFVDVGTVGNSIPQNGTFSAADSDGRVFGLSGSTQSASSGTSMTLQSGASSTNNYYKNGTIAFSSGPCSGQTGTITAYTGLTQVTTVSGLSCTPTSGGGDAYVVTMNLTAVSPYATPADTSSSNGYMPISASTMVTTQSLPIVGVIADSRISAEALDATPSGTGFPSFGCGYLPDYGPFLRGLNNESCSILASGYPFLMINRPGIAMSAFATFTNEPKQLAMLTLPDLIIIDLGINDVNSSTATTIAQNLSSLCKIIAAINPYARIWATTQTPLTYSTDVWTTATNQTPSGGIITNAVSGTGGDIKVTWSGCGNAPSNGVTVVISGVSGTTEANGTWVVKNESGIAPGSTFELTGSTFVNAFTGNGTVQNTTAETNRTTYNAFLRTAGATTRLSNSYWNQYTAPVSGYPNLQGYIDVASTVEVNSSNTIAANGGRWIVGSTYISNVLVNSATSTTVTTTATVSGFLAPASWGSNLFEGHALEITSGTDSGDIRSMSGSTAGTLTANSAFSITPDPTSVYEIIETGTYTRDGLGIHPSGYGCHLEAQAYKIPAEQLTW